jgi:hypothetical protein
MVGAGTILRGPPRLENSLCLRLPGRRDPVGNSSDVSRARARLSSWCTSPSAVNSAVSCPYWPGCTRGVGGNGGKVSTLAGKSFGRSSSSILSGLYASVREGAVQPPRPNEEQLEVQRQLKKVLATKTSRSHLDHHDALPFAREGRFAMAFGSGGRTDRWRRPPGWSSSLNKLRAPI